METHATTKKSWKSRISGMFKGKEKMKPSIPANEPLQIPTTFVSETPTQSPPREDPEPKAKAREEAVPSRRKKMRDLYPGYKGPKVTPKSPSPATLAQRRQRAARKLQRSK